MFGNDGNFGREGSGIEPSGKVGSFFENNIPFMNDTANIHDSVVDKLTDAGHPDIVANVPTMVPSFIAAILKNLAELPSDIMDLLGIKRDDC